MDSKQGFPSSAYEEESAPPSYNDSVSSTYSPVSPTSQYYSQQIQSQLSTLSTQLSSLSTQKTLLSHAQDEKVLSLLTHQIQDYLSDFAKTGLQKGTLILVPAKGLEEENAIPVEHDFKDPEEYDRVVRVRDSKGEGDGEIWFWRDEEMAQRLAEYLRPPPADPRTLELPPRKEEVKVAQPESGSSSRGFWGRKKSSTKGPPLVEQRRDSKVDPEARSGITEDKFVMSVTAEEVVFRTENDMGIYETVRGWGIVLKLTYQRKIN